MSYHIICDDFYEHFVHRHFPYITRSNRSGFGVTSIVFYFILFWNVTSYSSQYTTNYNSPVP